MKTNVIRMDELDEASLRMAADILKRGGLVAFPTETVYGLGANGLDAEAAAGIYLAKGRPSDNPLILHIADLNMMGCLAKRVNAAAQNIMRAFCPGPITVVLERKAVVPDRITGGLETVGVRMPDHPIARALIRLAGVPIAAPSANASGRPSPTTADMVLADLDGKIDAVIDGGPCRFGLESTIVDCTGSVPTVLRPGAITLEMLAEVVGEVKLDAALADRQIAPKAPGMKYTHYAPSAPMVLLKGGAEEIAGGMRLEIERAQAAGKRVGAIVSCETARRLPEGVVTVEYGAQNDLARIAANLYDALRTFDHHQVDVIFAEGTGDAGLGLAVMNRLYKASGYHVITV